MPGELFFGRKKEQEALHAMKEHSAEVHRAASKLAELAAALPGADPAALEALAGDVKTLESRADALRARVETLLQRGAFLPVLRGNLFSLTRRTDEVANLAEEAADELTVRPRLYALLPKKPELKPILRDLLALAGAAAQATLLLQEAVHEFDQDLDVSNQKLVRVGEVEHEARTLEDRVVRGLFAMEEKLDPVTLHQLTQVARLLRRVARAAEDASDEAFLITLRRRV
ncbi:MAG: DUF47 family protein [Euryarchaeota archaeon]|nr:DUF47 family protein [Euryarchaeota archaeon]